MSIPLSSVHVVLKYGTNLDARGRPLQAPHPMARTLADRARSRALPRPDFRRLDNAPTHRTGADSAGGRRLSRPAPQRPTSSWSSSPMSGTSRFPAARWRSPSTAVVREFKEELGLPAQPSRLLVIDWVPPRTDRTEGLLMVFDSGVLPRRRPTRPDYLPTNCAVRRGAPRRMPASGCRSDSPGASARRSRPKPKGTVAYLEKAAS